jgi:hypothetical protein
MNSDPTDREDKSAELTIKDRDELELLWQALYKAHENTRDAKEKEKYSQLMKNLSQTVRHGME